MSKIKIRKLKKEDIKIITKMMLEFPESYPQYYVNSRKRGGIQWLLQHLLSPEDVYDGGSYVLEMDSKVIGHIAYMKDVRCFEGGVYELRGLVINKEYQGKGFSKQMISYTEDRLKKIDGRIIWLQTEKSGNAYFEKRGFNKIAVYRNYWGKGRDRYVMSMEIY